MGGISFFRRTVDTRETDTTEDLFRFYIRLRALENESMKSSKSKNLRLAIPAFVNILAIADEYRGNMRVILKRNISRGRNCVILGRITRVERVDFKLIFENVFTGNIFHLHTRSVIRKKKKRKFVLFFFFLLSYNRQVVSIFLDNFSARLHRSI